MLVPPFYENFGKRLVKSPTLYFVDSGLACHLLNISSTPKHVCPLCELTEIHPRASDG